MGKRIKSRIGALERIKTLLLPISNIFVWLWGPVSLSYSSVKLVKGLLQGFYQIQNLIIIIKR